MIISIPIAYLLQQIYTIKKYILSTKSAKLMKFNVIVICLNICQFCPQGVDIYE